jgi:hypothetical protein
MWVLDVEEMKSFSKIDLKDVSWWMSFEDACKPHVSIIAKLSKERCNFLITGGRLSEAAQKHD